jgi:hypothetical protein
MNEGAKVENYPKGRSPEIFIEQNITENQRGVALKSFP